MKINIEKNTFDKVCGEKKTEKFGDDVRLW